MARVCHVLAAHKEGLPPDEGLTGLSSACGKFPFGLGRNAFPCSPGIRFGVLGGNVQYRIIFLGLYVAFRPSG